MTREQLTELIDFAKEYDMMDCELSSVLMYRDFIESQSSDQN